MDNDLYQAMREGRVPLQVDIQQNGDGFTARYEGFGVEVEVKDNSQSFAQSEVIRRVLEKVRNNEFVVKVA